MPLRSEVISVFRAQNPQATDWTDEDIVIAHRNAGVDVQDDPADDLMKFASMGLPEEPTPVEDRGFFNNVVTAAKRGFASAAQGANILQGADDATNARDIADYERIKQANPASKEFQDFMRAEGFGESAKAFAKAPVRIISEVMAESLAQSLPSMALGFAGGSVSAGPVGSAIGTGVGAGAGSALTEYASATLQAMQEAGMDPANPESIQSFFSDPEKVASAREFALKRGVAVGLFDGISAGLAGRFIRPLAESGARVGTGKVVAASAKELGMQAGLGAAGDAAAQLASEGKISDGKSIFLEGVAEVGSAPGEAFSNLRDLSFKSPAAAPTQQTPTLNPIRQRAPLAPTIPEMVVPESAPAVETAAAPAASTPAPVLATQEQQDVLVNVLGMSPEQAATVPASEAETLIAEFEAEQEQVAIEEAAKRQAAALAARRQMAADLAAGFEADQREMPVEDFTGTASVQQANALIRAQQKANAARAKSLDETFGKPSQGGQGYLPGMIPTAAQRRSDLQPGQPAPVEQPLPEPKGQIPLFANVRGAKKAAATIAGEAPKTAGFAEVQTPQAAPQLADPEALGAPAPAKETSAPVESAPAPSAPVDNQPAAQPAPSGAEDPLVQFDLGAKTLAPDAVKDVYEPASVKIESIKERPGQTRFLAWMKDGRVLPIAYVGNKEFRLGASARDAKDAYQKLTVIPGKRGPLKPTAIQGMISQARPGHEVFTAGKERLLGEKLNLDNVESIVELHEAVSASRIEGEIPQPVQKYTASSRSGTLPSDLLDHVAGNLPAGLPANLTDEQALSAFQSALSVEPADKATAAKVASARAALESSSAKERMARDVIGKALARTPSGPVEVSNVSTPEPLPPVPANPAPAPVKSETLSDAENDLSRQHGITREKVEELFDRESVPERDQISSALLNRITQNQAVRSAANKKLREVYLKLGGRLSLTEANQPGFNRVFNEVWKDVVSRGEEIVAERDVPSNLVDTYAYKNPVAVFRTAESLARQGVSTTFGKRDLLPDGSTFDRVNETITSVISNVAAPSRMDAANLFHEAVHFISNRAPASVREAAHRAMAEVVVENSPARNANASPEEKLAESMALKGVDREVATNFAAEVVRLIKDWLLRGAMWAQEQLLGKDNVSGVLATQWVQNHLDRFMAGDRLTSFLDTFPKRDVARGVALYAARDGVRVLHFTSDGVPVFRPTIGDTPEAIEYNVNAEIAIEKAKMLADGSLDLAALANENPLLFRDVVIQRSKDRVQEIRDEQGRLLAPNGKPSKLKLDQWKLVRTPEFKNWFGDWESDPVNASKVVDENGEPMVMYHGTNSSFNAFSHSAPKNFPEERNTTGTFFFTTDPKLAKNYADGQGGNLVPAFLNVRSPFVQQRTGEFLDDLDEPTRNALETMGRIPASGLSFLMNDVVSVPDNTDGLVVRIRNSDPSFVLQPQDIVAAFNPTQIKSIFNEGEFSPDNPDILKRDIPFEEENKQRTGFALQSTLARVRRQVAAINEVAAFQKQVAAELAKIGVKDIRSLGFMDTDALKAKYVTELNAMLEREVAAPEGPLFSDGIRIDDESFNESERALAENEYREMVSGIKRKLGEKDAEARDFLAGRAFEAEGRRQRLAEIAKTLSDAKEQRRLAVSEIVDQANRLVRKGIPGEVEAAEKDAHSRAVIEQLDKDAARLFETDRAQKIVDSLTRDLDDISLESVFNALFRIEKNNDISLADTPPSTLRKLVLEAVETDAALRPLVTAGEGPDAKVKGTALLSAILGFVKKDAVLADSIRARMTGLKENAERLNTFRAALQEENEVRLQEIMANAKSMLKLPGNTAIYTLLKEREKLRALDRDTERFEKVRQATRFSLPILQDALVKVEARRQIGYDASNFYYSFDESGAPVARPLAELYDGDKPNGERTRAARKAIEEWVETQQPGSREYYTALDMISELKSHEIDHVQKIRSGIFSRYSDDLIRQLRAVGLSEFNAVADMVTKNENIKRAFITRVYEFGVPVDRAKQKLTRAVGGDRQLVEEMWRRSKSIMQSPELDQRDGLSAVRSDFAADVRFTDVARDPKKWALFEKWIKASDESNKFVASMFKKYGFRVADTVSEVNPVTGKPEEPLLRSYLERGGYEGSTYLTGYSDEARLVADAMYKMYKLVGDGPGNPIREFSKSVDQDPQAAFAAVDGFFKQGDIAKRFIEPLVNNPRGGVPAPVGPDGLKLGLDPSVARAAWEKADGSVIQFADNVLRTMGMIGDESAPTQEGVTLSAEYRKAVAQFFSRKASRLITDVASKPTDAIMVDGVSRIAVDSRVEHNDPPEWLSPTQVGTEELRNIVHSVAAQTAFGVDGRRLELAAQLAEARMMEAARVMSSESLRAKLEATDKQEYKRVQKLAEQYETRWKGLEVKRAVMLESDPTAGSAGNLPFIQDMLSAAVVSMLANVRSAMNDLSSFMRPIFFERSLEAATLGRVAVTAKEYARGGLFSLIEATNPWLKLQNDEYDLTIQRAQGGSTANYFSSADAFTGNVTSGANNRLVAKPGSTLMRKAEQLAHRRVFLPLREVLTNGSVGYTKGSNVVLRANPFAWLSEVQRVGSLRTYMQAVHRYAKIAQPWVQANPGKTLLESPLAKSTAFFNLYTKLGQAGLKLEDFASRVSDNKSVVDLFTDEDVHAINGVIQDNLMLEAGPATRPRILRESRLGRSAGTLVGWSLGATNQWMDMFKTREGLHNYASVLRGAGITMAAVMPLAVGFSFLLDYYDEDILGKKRFVRRLQGNPEEVARAALDRMTLVGPLGIGGEVLNMVTNNDPANGRKLLSIDERVVPVSMTLNFIKAISDLASVGVDNATYAENYRQLLMAAGGNGLLQNVQLVNALMDKPMFGDEAVIAQRQNAANYFRIGAREIGIEMDKRGRNDTTMDPLTPNIGAMYRAALRDDPEAFQKAYRKAVEAAKGLPGQTDPRKRVAERFADRHILRSAITGKNLSRGEVAAVLDRLPPEGRAAVEDAIRLHNRYGSALGVKPYVGTEKLSDAMKLRAMQRATGANSASVNDITAALAAKRNNVLE